MPFSVFATKITILFTSAQQRVCISYLFSNAANSAPKQQCESEFLYVMIRQLCIWLLYEIAKCVQCIRLCQKLSRIFWRDSRLYTFEGEEAISDICTEVSYVIRHFFWRIFWTNHNNRFVFDRNWICIKMLSSAWGTHVSNVNYNAFFYYVNLYLYVNVSECVFFQLCFYYAVNNNKNQWPSPSRWFELRMYMGLKLFHLRSGKLQRASNLYI